MKKAILSLVVAASVSGNMYAQEHVEYVSVVKPDFRDQMMFGLKAGTNYSNVYDAQGEEFRADAKFGFAAGAFLAIPLGKFLGVQPEVLYSQKGFHATGNILGNPYEFTRTTNYIDVPVFLALKPAEFLTILAGPQYSYLMKQKDVFSSAIVNTAQETEFKNDNIRKNTVSLAGGIDVNVQHVVISARAGWDFTNNNGNGTSSTPRYKNTWVQATIGFRF
jgi:hypothetical protein